ncbi:hypothetical protein ACIFQM_17500 [Paenibacillus sp. NRS-1782]|uniref:hypothetical protein n=1 Tax=unclassified Paenibacillus TaxID=185978 RepID=UPI003D2C64E6
MVYMSKTQFRIMLKSELDAIESINWSQMIPRNELSKHVPSKEGVLVLMNVNQEIIYLSATDDMVRRMDELLNKSKGRFNDTAFVQFTLELDRITRFAKKGSLKNLLELLEIGEDNLANVLDDDDPRIIQIVKEINDLRQK